MKIKIDYEKCCWKDGKCTSCQCGGSCTGCVEMCPVQAISRGDVVKINEELCISCGACISACEHSALSFE
jgi:NAD-dependent dihydropyrimidine dehydrogenase PreA subunit